MIKRKCLVLSLLTFVSILLIGMLAVTPSSTSTDQSTQYLVGASYMTFWGTGMDIDWSSGAVYWPILGNYSSNNKAIANQHIEWALQYGVDFFYLDYGWSTGSDKDKMENAAIEGLLRAESMENFSFCIFYFPYRVVNSGFVNEITLTEDFSHINETYFNRSSYLRLHNRSVVILADFPMYLKKGLSYDEINSLFLGLKENYTLYLIPAFWPDQPSDAFNVLTDPRRVYDAITLWGSTTIVELNREIGYSEYINKTESYFETWSDISKDYEVHFVPLISPGYDNTIYYNMGKRDWWAIVNRDANGFLEVCQLAGNYSSPPHNMVLLFTWNDFKEGTSIEPTTEYGFTYLNAVRTIPEFPRFLILPLFMITTLLAGIVYKKKETTS